MKVDIDNPSRFDDNLVAAVISYHSSYRAAVLDSQLFILFGDALRQILEIN